MKRNYLSTTIILLILVLFSISIIHAQEPQPTEDSSITNASPSEVEHPFTPPIEEQRCEPVRPDQLENVSAEEIIQHWLNYAECKGIDINQIPEPILLKCGPGDYKCEEINKHRQTITVDYDIWFMSSHSITLSQGLDPDLKEYMRNVPSGHLVPVILQLKRDTSIAEMIELINLGLRYYRGSTLQNGAYLTFIPASSINEIVSKPYVAGVTLFKPSFKYTQIPKTENKIETHIYTIEETKSNHESDLKRIGVDVLSYDDTLKLYVVKMSSSQYDDVANLRWTKLITIVPESISESELTEATNKSNNYVLSGTTTRDESNLIIYVVTGIIFLIILIFLLLKTKRR